MLGRVETVGNRISITGGLQLDQLWRMSATIYNLTSKSGFSDLILDFSGCSAAMPGPMLGLCAEISALRERKINVSLVLPTNDRLARLFVNANWAFTIDPGSHKRSTYRGYVNLPVIRFHSHKEQPAVVNRLVESILSSIPGIAREDLAAVEWSLNEITDNVLVHSQSPCGGFVQLANYSQRRRVEFSVADAGVSIPATLRARFATLTDPELLEKATNEGITRDPALGQGNGLYGTFRVASSNGGTFQLLSGHGLLKYANSELRLTNERVPFPGTLVVASIDCANPLALADALRFGDEKYKPLDYVELRYEDRTSDDLIFRMHEEALSFGSRGAGTPIRNRIANLVRMNPGRRLRVDMSQVPLLSSSFADEVFGKLFRQLGPTGYSSAIDLVEVGQTARALIDKAIFQRMQSRDD